MASQMKPGAKSLIWIADTPDVLQGFQAIKDQADAAISPSASAYSALGYR
jgi:hypothetical protein